MSEAEWRDGDDPKVRALFGYALRPHVTYQDGRHSEAPALVFADYDYEVGDGVCGLHADGKSANEPAIVYVRADALIDAHDRLATARNDALDEAAEWHDGRAMQIIQQTKMHEHDNGPAKVMSREDGAIAVAHHRQSAAALRTLKSETKP